MFHKNVKVRYIGTPRANLWVGREGIIDIVLTRKPQEAQFVVVRWNPLREQANYSSVNVSDLEVDSSE